MPKSKFTKIFNICCKHVPLILCRSSQFEQMLYISVNFDFCIMKKLWDLAHEKLVNIIGGHCVGINIHGCQPYPVNCHLGMYWNQQTVDYSTHHCIPLYRDDRKSCLSLQSTKWKNFLLRLTWLAQPSYIYIQKLIGEYFLNLLKVLNLEKTVKRNK